MSRYETDIRIHLKPRLGHIRLDRLRVSHELDPVRKPKALVWTDERVAKWRETGEKPSSVMVWTPKQTGAFLDHVAGDRLYAMWHLIAFRGPRRGEACGQPRSETDLANHTLTVTTQLVQDGWEVETSGPKTDSGFRVVALDDDSSKRIARDIPLALLLGLIADLAFCLARGMARHTAEVPWTCVGERCVSGAGAGLRLGLPADLALFGAA